MRRLITISLLVIGWPALAGQPPSTGLLYKANSASSLSYSCRSLSEDRISCDFVQTSVRRQREPESVPIELAKLSESTVTDEIGSPGSEKRKRICSNNELLRAVISGDTPASSLPDSDPTEVTHGLARMADYERDFLLAVTTELVELCKTNDLEHFITARRLMLEREARTCLVSSNPFHQTLEAAEGENGEKYWIVDEPPAAPCGLKQLSRFLPSPRWGELFWDYVGERKTLNKEATTPFGMKCSDFDETAERYNIRDSERALRCDYIKFSLF